MTTQHTPGPWVLDGFNMAAVLHCTAARGTPEAKHTCGDYEIIARFHGENWKANARLASLSPEMLDMLYTLLPYIEDAENDPAYKSGAPAKIRKDLIALIGKAEGK